MIGCTKTGSEASTAGSGGTATGGAAGGGAGTSSSVTRTGGATTTGGAAGTGGLAGTGGMTTAGGAVGTGGGTGGATGTGGASGGAGGRTDSGRTGGSGGTASTLVSTGTGGATGRGGSSAAGGTTATGGAPGTGGSMGRGGSSAAGGTTVTGGAPGTGGATARGGAGGVLGSGGNSGSGGASSGCPPATPSTGGKQYCSNGKGSVGATYSYELWASGNGSGCMTVYGVDAKFSATWTNVEDFLGRVGLLFDQTKTPSQIGTITAEFAETKTATSGLVYVGIYGWTVDPLREYYILDDWGSERPAGTASDGTPRTKVGTIIVDGDTYDVWKKTRTNKPAITGDSETFDQYFSIRQTARQCGRISVSEHFSQWIGLGLQLGKLHEAKLLIEAQNGSGTIDFTTATVQVK